MGTRFIKESSFLRSKIMPYTIDDAIYKLNQMSNENAEFREEMRRTTTEMQQELNSLKNEVRALKNHDITVDQSVAPNLTPMQPTVSTANTLIGRIPRRPACTFLQGDADKPRLLGYIRETMNLVEERGDSEVVKMRKTESANSALCDLEGMAKTVCGAMANAVSQDPSLDKSKITWGKVPTHYRERGLKTLIATAKQFNFHLDRSVGDWAPLLLLSSSYHNNYNPKKSTSSNRSEQNTAGSSGNVEESIEQERHLAQTSHDSEHSIVSESSAMASKRRRQETLNEGQSAQQSTRPQMRRRKQ